jgi:hypothetical protein
MQYCFLSEVKEKEEKKKKKKRKNFQILEMLTFWVAKHWFHVVLPFRNLSAFQFTVFSTVLNKGSKAGHVARIENMRNSYSIFVGISEETIEFVGFERSKHITMVR